MGSTWTKPKFLIARIAADLSRLADTVTAIRRSAVPPEELPVPKLMLSVEDTAEALLCSRSAVFELIKHGKLVSTKIGRRRLIPMASIQSYIAGLGMSLG